MILQCISTIIIKAMESRA